MHILLGLLGTIVTILVLLYRLSDIGIELGGFNPFSWRRRRAWRQKFEANPIFSLEDPREVAAALLLGDMEVMNAQRDDLLSRYREQLAENQVDSLLEILNRIAALGGGPTAQQSELIDAIRQTLGPQAEPQGTWG